MVGFKVSQILYLYAKMQKTGTELRFSNQCRENLTAENIFMKQNSAALHNAFSSQCQSAYSG